MADVRLDLSGFELVLEGLPPGFAQKMAAEWSAFVAPRTREPLLRVLVEVDDPAETAAPFEPQTMTLRIAGGEGEYSLPGGHAWLDKNGTLRVKVDSAGLESYFNVVNLLIAALATRLPTRGAALVHAGCLLIDGRAYLLVGSEGAGKSTWTRLGQQGGAVAVGDDLVLVEGTEVLGSPFRSRHLPGEAVPGRWPIAALLFPKHGSPATLTPANRLLASARLTANLPFVSAAASPDPDAVFFTDRLVTAVPCHELTFTLDDSFLSLLR